MSDTEPAQYARLWTLNHPEDDADNEFVWRPDLAGLQLLPSHIESLLDGLDSRTTEITLAARDFRNAKELILAACAASGAPPFSRDEMEVTAMRLVTNLLAKHMGSEICNFHASFSEELGSLVLTLHDFDRTFDEGFQTELADVIQKSLSSETAFLPTLGVAATRHASVAKTQRRGLTSAGLALGAGAAASGGSALLAVGMAAAAAGVGATAVAEPEPTTPAVGHAVGRGTSKDLQVANAVSTLKGLLKSGLKLQLQDEVAEEELVLAVQLAAETSKHAQLVVSDEGMPSLMVPLGPLGEGNPLFEAGPWSTKAWTTVKH
ncbi:unnamed protein product [Effrenium voratum]|uniref:Uncharacterized protein n=1 Tax=Effrenium voratum TaxID=2562239 RepID=A0AA36MYA5_9DINO|nr:unnamed protein product [Effrenium voratum]